MTRRLPLFAGVLAAALVLVGCGSDGGGGGVSAAPAQTKVTVTAGDTAPFALQGGQYKFAWTTNGCASFSFELKQRDGGFDWKKETKVPRFSAIILGVPAGTYTVTQSEAACTDWSVALERIGS